MEREINCLTSTLSCSKKTSKTKSASRRIAVSLNLTKFKTN